MDLEEAMAAGLSESNFKLIDSDGSGTITREEFIDCMEKGFEGEATHTRKPEPDIDITYTATFDAASAMGLRLAAGEPDKGLEVLIVEADGQASSEEVHVGDVAIAINGVSTVGMSLEEAAPLLRDVDTEEILLELEGKRKAPVEVPESRQEQEDLIRRLEEMALAHSKQLEEMALTHSKQLEEMALAHSKLQEEHDERDRRQGQPQHYDALASQAAESHDYDEISDADLHGAEDDSLPRTPYVALTHTAAQYSSTNPTDAGAAAPTERRASGEFGFGISTPMSFETTTEKEIMRVEGPDADLD